MDSDKGSRSVETIRVPPDEMDESLTGLIRRLVERGVFGRGRFASLRPDESANPLVVRTSSEVTLLKLRVKLPGCDTKTIPFVVKTQFANSKFRRRRDLDVMFRNEVAMYDAVLPFLDSGDTHPYPKVFFGGKDEFDQDVLILENLRSSGYSAGGGRVFLDFNHLAVALRTLAQLHSWSYVRKKQDPDKFFKLVGGLEKIVRARGDEDFDFDKMNYLCIKRGVDPLLKTEKDSKILQDFLKISKDIAKVINFLQEADETFGVVVHGDYSVNNLAFKYDYRGKPIDCAYFDFQLSQYATPAVDVAFFLYMHTSPETREDHWETLLKIYWDYVREFVPTEIVLPTYEEFHEHLASRAVYGYMVCSFYLPNILEENVITDSEFDSLSSKEKVGRFVQSAGESGQKYISDIVRHMLKKEYIHKFLKRYVKKYSP